VGRGASDWGDDVLAEQRAHKEPERFAPQQNERWTPYTVHGRDERRDVPARPGDRYVTVDDVADGVVVFDVSDWPVLDPEGRLHWTTPPVEAWAGLAEVQERIDEDRRSDGLLAPDRALRVGDAFLVRGLPRSVEGEPPRMLDAEHFTDISAAARDAAKAALFGAAASTLDPADAEALAVERSYEAARGAGEFDVRQVPLDVPSDDDDDGHGAER
jgi:hypothetical protein